MPARSRVQNNTCILLVILNTLYFAAYQLDQTLIYPNYYKKMSLANSTRTSSAKAINRKRLNLWFERLMALLALANYCLVLFDISYIPFRDFWLEGKMQLFIKVGPFEKEIPQRPIQVLPFNLTPAYDWVKGIVPYRDTEIYLRKVDLLNEKISEQGLQSPEEAAATAVQSAKEIDDILGDLRERSIAMINTNPFQIADKTGTLERIKNKMREHIFDDPDASSKQAFEIFWSRDYLNKAGYREQLNFFDEQIKPLIATNYFRAIGENGKPIDNFGLLDFPFFLIFLTEFLLRSWYISRQHQGLSWFDAMLWRWYDIFLLIPVWRWLRIIPVVIRLDQSKLIDLKRIQKQTKQGFVASIADDITQVIIVQVINQVQASIADGELRNLLFKNTVNPYIDLNEVNETAEIAKLVSRLVVCDVLPKVHGEFEELLQYNLQGILSQNPAYQNLEKLPGFKNIENQLSRQVANQVYKTFIDLLRTLVEEDPEFDRLVDQLMQNLQQTMAKELQSTHSFEQLESLLAALLEEIKVNYVQRLSHEDIEQILEQTRTLGQRS